MYLIEKGLGVGVGGGGGGGRANHLVFLSPVANTDRQWVTPPAAG